MRRLSFAVRVVCLAVSLSCFAGNLAIVPSTTLAAQSSNNTSAANNFQTQSNGNRGATNVSKVNVHSLLYSGASTLIYAHMVPWFGQSNHMNVGYSSASPSQIHQQVVDMISRGIDGVILDWYGPNNTIDTATQLVMHEAELHPGFKFAIMIDQGAIQWDSCGGCSPQQALIQQLQYVEQIYFPSPAYLRIDGAPVLGNFDIDQHYTVDWKSAAAALATNPAFIFQNNPGFNHLLSDGSDAWVMPTTSDYGMSYLTSFYQAGIQYPQATTLGGAYKGFNDSLAAWGAKRVMGQQCGATWLQTFSKINSLYNSSRQLPALQLVTWNDYEEGTEIESGIDNCVSLTSKLSGSTLRWSVSGKEDTIDHYVTYISTDGQNLMQLGSVAAGQHSVNLCSYSLAPRTYQLYVQAIGKPSLTNHISGTVPYSPHCSSTGRASVTLSASPSTVTLSASRAGSSRITATPQSGKFDDSISLSCSGLPQGLTCSFAPNHITPGASEASSILTVSAVGNSAGARNTPGQPVYAAWLGFGILGFAGIGQLRRRPVIRISLTFLVIGLAVLLCSCGAGQAHMTGSSSTGVPRGSYTIAIHGDSAASQVSTPAVLRVK